MVTTAAPLGPAQPAFTTPLAHTTAFASDTKATLKTIAETNNKAFIDTLPCFGRVCAADVKVNRTDITAVCNKVCLRSSDKGRPGG